MASEVEASKICTEGLPSAVQRLIEVFIEIALVDSRKGRSGFERGFIPRERAGRVEVGVVRVRVVGHETEVHEIFKRYLHLLGMIAQPQLAVVYFDKRAGKGGFCFVGRGCKSGKTFSGVRGHLFVKRRGEELSVGQWIDGYGSQTGRHDEIFSSRPLQVRFV